VSRITFLRRAFEKRRQTREFEPTHVGCYAEAVFVAPIDKCDDLRSGKGVSEGRAPGAPKKWASSNLAPGFLFKAEKWRVEKSKMKL
jgi:hypothetical protein